MYPKLNNGTFARVSLATRYLKYRIGPLFNFGLSNDGFVVCTARQLSGCFSANARQMPKPLVVRQEPHQLLELTVSNLPSGPMSNELCIPQPLHQPLKHLCRAMQPKVLLHTRIAKPKTRYTWRYNMESLLCAVDMTWQRVWICQSIDDALDLDE
jgi:hypothetical protein